MEPKYDATPFEPFDDAGRLEISWDGPPLDLYGMAMLQLNLSDIVEQVVRWHLHDRVIAFPPLRRPTSWRGLVRSRTAPEVVRAIPRVVRVGSLFQEVSFVIASMMADNDVRAVLQNLAANTVWAIGASRVRGVEGGPQSAPKGFLPSVSNQVDPVDVGPNVRGLVLALAEQLPPDARASVSIRDRSAERDCEVRIVVDRRKR